jgi:hypothetical protein
LRRRGKRGLRDRRRGFLKRLGERQAAELVEDDEVHPGQMLGDTTLPSVAGLDLQAVDEVDHVPEAA